MNALHGQSFSELCLLSVFGGITADLSAWCLLVQKCAQMLSTLPTLSSSTSSIRFLVLTTGVITLEVFIIWIMVSDPPCETDIEPREPIRTHLGCTV